MNYLFKYRKTIDFGKYNNGDETFFSKCEHYITKFIFRIHQTDEIIVNDLPILSSYFPGKGLYDVTCKSEIEKECTHSHKNTSTYKIEVNFTDIIAIKIFIEFLRIFIFVGLTWLIILGLNTFI